MGEMSPRPSLPTLTSACRGQMAQFEQHIKSSEDLGRGEEALQVWAWEVFLVQSTLVVVGVMAAWSTCFGCRSSGTDWLGASILCKPVLSQWD